MKSASRDFIYYITFMAFTPHGLALTFQTKICDFPSHPFPKFEIMFVKIKTSKSDRNKSKNSEEVSPLNLITRVNFMNSSSLKSSKHTPAILDTMWPFISRSMLMSVITSTRILDTVWPFISPSMLLSVIISTR